jgi:long-chain acyl-CoA synthetase
VESPAGILPSSAARWGGKTALVTGRRALTFAELNRMSDRFAAGLAVRGVRPGEPVALYTQNRWEWVVAYHGVLKAGAVVVPINAMLVPDEVAHVLGDCGAVALITSVEQVTAVVELAGKLPDLRLIVRVGRPDRDVPAAGGTVVFDELLAGTGQAPDLVLDGDAPCTIAYTSGTTGYPKGAVQSHRAVLLNCALAATMHGRTAQDVVVTALPAPHVYGNVVLNGTLLAGGTVVLMDRFAAGAALRFIGAYRATMFDGVPAMYAMMLADPDLPVADLTSLTRCTVGGQTIPVATIERWEARSGARLIELWGMTEVCGNGTTHALYAPPVPGSCGVSLPGVEVRIADPDDPRREAPRGVPGELMIRGPIVMLGYHGNPEATAEVLTPDGWLHSGDIATMDGTGHVFIVDRRKEVIITGGYNVYPAEIERVLAVHPDVSLVAVGAVPDPVMGELACAYVVRAAGSTASGTDLIAYAGEHLAAYKRPRLVRFVDQLPTTPSGKIMRRALIDLFTP